MKNTFFILVTCLSLGFSAGAQVEKKKTSPVKSVNVPENVNNTFKSLYAVATEDQWNKNYSGNYVVTFTNAENLKQTAEFTGSGAMIKSKVAYMPDALPQNLITSITAQYPNAKVTEAAKLQLPGVAPYYRVKIMSAENISKELLISEEGTISE
ncbi:MAG: PepSY-like domain-containing protein [Ferruginibacter sp.]